MMKFWRSSASGEGTPRVDNHDKTAKVHCNSCQRDTNHIVQGMLTKPGLDPFPEFEAAILKSSVETFFQDRLHWPTSSSGWQWLNNADRPHPDDDLQAIIQELESWFDTDMSLEQDLWYEDFATWKLMRQGWRWIDILQACERGFEAEERWEIVECRGCKTLAFRFSRWSEVDDSRDPSTGNLLERNPHFERFPPVSTIEVPAWASPEWVDLLPHDIRRPLEDIYKALNAGLLSLGVMGLRSVLEIVIINQTGIEGNFKNMLQRLVQDNRVSKQDSDALDAAINSGHAAVHRRHYPTVEEVQTVIGVVEGYLHREFVQPAEIDLLKRRTPPKAPRKSSRERNIGAKD
jgi:hypothetical protein